MTVADTRPALVFVGPMGAGKSSIGRKVARALERPFSDTDSIIAQQHGPIPRIFEEHGEAAFRMLEEEAVAAAVASGGVVALGGGAVTSATTRTLLADHDVVLLTVQPQVLRKRLSGGGRPLLDGADPIAEWMRIYDQRHAWYDEVADVTFDTSSGPIRLVVEEIVNWVQEGSHEHANDPRLG